MLILHKCAGYLTRTFIDSVFIQSSCITMLPKGHGGEKINIDDKVLLEYYKLEKDFEGPIELESIEGGYTPISGDSVIESLRKTR